MTEKNYNPQQKEKKAIKKQEVAKVDAPVEAKKPEIKEEKAEVKKPEVKKKEIPKKDYALANGQSLHISTKTAGAICRFIKKKRIPDAIKDLDDVIKLRRAVPMKGEIPHRKGKGIMSGRFPKRAAEDFKILLRTLAGNANVNGLEDPVIAEAIANSASHPYGRFGRVQKKRTHVKIVVKEKVIKKKSGDKE